MQHIIFFNSNFRITSIGRPRSMLYDSGSEIRTINGSIDIQRSKRRSEIESLAEGNSNEHNSFNDIIRIKSCSLERSNTASWISPFSRRKLKKSRSTFHTQSEIFGNPNCDEEKTSDKKVNSIKNESLQKRDKLMQWIIILLSYLYIYYRNHPKLILLFPEDFIVFEENQDLRQFLEIV